MMALVLMNVGIDVEVDVNVHVVNVKIDVVNNDIPVEDSLLQGRQAELPDPGVRRKYFAMPPMSVEDAVHQLQVIDHDFYLFRDKDTNTLQVVYQRNHGGYGVIQARD